MKKLLLLFFLSFYYIASAQITTPIIKANFGVDGDLRANVFNGSVQSSDDWFSNGTLGTGTFVIDTTGAWAIRNGYATDVSPYRRRSASFFRTMSKPQFSVVNNRLWMDALFVRDYHGADTTAFVSGADKNGMSPGSWTGGTQGVPDKNDILDVFMHVRRAGPNSADSLWLFGGLSLASVTGNRYFDFEMYQTDINYDRASGRWFGYGPDAGHTSWKFDAAGKVITPGDIIFSAEYQSSSLSSIEARIWVHKDALNTKPDAFNWSGKFDGAGSGATYGYASILPKTDGAFYTGLQSGTNEWAGPFNLVLQDNSLVTEYSAKQFMEFSVNLTKLGLDPITTFGSDVCGTPFKRIVIKTRASASFTAELKDFVAPTDLFLAPRVQAVAEISEICGSAGISQLKVVNAIGSSVYTWSTPDGNLVGNSGSEVYADKAGTYIVTQQLMGGCSVYASDTVQIVYDQDCSLLNAKGLKLNASLEGNYPLVRLLTQGEGSNATVYELQRSTNGYVFERVLSKSRTKQNQFQASYNFMDEGVSPNGKPVYYRVKAIYDGTAVYSEVVKVDLPLIAGMHMFPNPAKKSTAIRLAAAKKGTAELNVSHLSGVPVLKHTYMLELGDNIFNLPQVQFWPAGIYVVQVRMGGAIFRQRLVVSGN